MRTGIAAKASMAVLKRAAMEMHIPSCKIYLKQGAALTMRITTRRGTRIWTKLPRVRRSEKDQMIL